MTAAHYQVVSLSPRLREWVPQHDPREEDPHYGLFKAAKRQMKKSNIPCWRCNVHYDTLVRKGDPPTKGNPLAAYQLEAHHNEIEFSLLNAIDVAGWWDSSHREDAGFMVESFSKVDGWLTKHPELEGKSHEEMFVTYMESEGNLQQLCDVCHRSKEQGIHHIPYPDWRPGPNVWKQGMPPHIVV